MENVLHIGAHRTGSTMVAQSLTATINERPDCGLALWRLRQLGAILGFQAAASGLDVGQIATVNGMVNAGSDKTSQPAISSDDSSKHPTHFDNHHVGWITTADNTRWIGEGAV